ncbi:phosphotransferase [Allorhizocola rhizosphaerae]|uniref:phosphotransferase n=1 Tax=Allorhizocola rhizosphaerae TaxID=1872709 RepID=UPI000E3C5FC0|nr:phosphotransferase [Allorhizocola rhizosphaerae]
MTLFIKRYPDGGRAAKARANHRWLTSLNSGVLLPDLVHSGKTALAFTKLDGSTPSADDLVTLAATIGRLQRAAFPALTTARLDRTHSIGTHDIEDFTESRRAALHTAAAAHGTSPQWTDAVLDRAAGMPPAFYKDSNLRNFILTPRGVAIVDFDDLTLAPHGYDLAKLIVSTAMTHGRIEAHAVSAALDAYNTTVGHNACIAMDLTIWAELNWLFTANYLGRNGYRHPWPLIRPWADPLREGIR